MIESLGPLEKIIASPFIGIIPGSVCGTLYTCLARSKGVTISAKEILKNYIIWGVAEHAIRGLTQALFFAFKEEKNASMRIFADRSILILSGITGVSTLFEKELMGNHMEEDGIHWLIGVVIFYCFNLYDFTLSPHLTDVKPIEALMLDEDN